MEELWTELSSIKEEWQAPWWWCLTGDFNIICFVDERNRGGPFSNAMMRFSEWVDMEGLLDLPTPNLTYTWSNFRGAPSLAKLDRFLVCSEWEEVFPGCKARGLPRVTSDHTPLLLTSHTAPPKKCPFQYEA
ncbi:hypothetical protein QJS10_CPB18g00243 [Acorus calamus]|uniref:Endonuclease/exonuclease/phosphatase domain-containing protein n=1 Tax=Acorus calamus TaxID=4465 RepID=A0AAV9CND4_ACOCL|nr:hypothetical protein QJS10_CPB18g00243 [Acorus calamus]